MLTLLYLAIRIILIKQTIRSEDEALSVLWNVVKSPISIIFFIVVVCIAIFCYVEFKDDILPDPKNDIKYAFSFLGVLALMVSGLTGTIAVLSLIQGSESIIKYAIGMTIAILCVAGFAVYKAISDGDSFIVGLGYFFCYEVYLILRGLALVLCILLFGLPAIPILIGIADEHSRR